MLAAASIKVMDALFGFLAQNDAECYKRELLGRSWRRDWAMRIFQAFCPIGQNLPGGQFFCGLDTVGQQKAGAGRGRDAPFILDWTGEGDWAFDPGPPFVLNWTGRRD